jgi:hypothetical protein
MPKTAYFRDRFDGSTLSKQSGTDNNISLCFSTSFNAPNDKYDF